jgi:dienelactone hydrolase
MKRHACLNVVLLLVASTLIMSPATLRAQQAQRIYSICVMGAPIGQETSVIDLAPDGQSIHASANSTITIQGMPITMKHDLLVTTDYQLRQYTLEAEVAGTTQRVTVVVEGNSVAMKAEAGPTRMAQSVSWQRGMVVLENNTAFDWEFLVRQYDRKAGGDQQFHALVPSQLMSTPISVRLVGSGTATLNGSSIETENFVAKMMEIEVKIWQAKETGQVLKIAVPSQQAEMMLQGASCTDFTVPPATSAAPQDFTEKEVTFQSGKYTLYGTLTLPASAPKPVPGVVLVHGSGPNDRDETIGANKPFRDLAHGLAARGLAVLRYDKRTYTYRTKLTQKDIANLTLKEEVLDDALSAIAFLREQPEVNQRMVFLLGHSLGAWCAPFIAAQDSQLAGIIMLAPPAGEFDDAFIRQTRYRADVTGTPSEEIDKLIAEVKQGFTRLREKTFPPDQFLLGASGKYWYDYLNRKPMKVATGLPQPILVLQGEKDYQSTMDDFAAWKTALSQSGKKNVQIQSFPQLNHLFIPVEGPSTGQEYAIAGTVAPQVIDRIAQFCLHPPGRSR